MAGPSLSVPRQIVKKARPFSAIFDFSFRRTTPTVTIIDTVDLELGCDSFAEFTLPSWKDFIVCDYKDAAKSIKSAPLTSDLSNLIPNFRSNALIKIASLSAGVVGGVGGGVSAVRSTTSCASNSKSEASRPYRCQPLARLVVDQRRPT
jgi:hypothetical protein